MFLLMVKTARFGAEFVAEVAWSLLAHGIVKEVADGVRAVHHDFGEAKKVLEVGLADVALDVEDDIKHSVAKATAHIEDEATRELVKNEFISFGLYKWGSSY